MTHVELLDTLDSADFESLKRLVGELSKTAPELTRTAAETLVSDQDVLLLVARCDRGEIKGCLVVTFVATLTGVRAHIDDVVVSASDRGTGLGRVLVEAGLESAGQRRPLRSVDLTSSSHRSSARGLYESCGFVLRDSSLFRYTIDDASCSGRSEVAAK